jgi:hypothetical protein
MQKKLLTATLTLSLLASTTFSQVIVGWDFDPLTGGSGNFGPSPYAATTTAPNVTVTSGGLVRNWTLGAGTGGANAWGGNNFDTSATDFATALAANNFASFTLQANPGYQLSFSSIDPYNIRRSGTGPTTGRWQYQVGAAPFVDLTPDITWGAVTTAPGNPQALIDLSTITALQNATAPITFRVVTWGATGTAGTWYLNDPTGTPGDDFTLSGSVTLIPEPGTYALLAFALVAIVLVRRRLEKKSLA